MICDLSEYYSIFWLVLDCFELDCFLVVGLPNADAVAMAVASADVGASASTAGSFTSVPCYGYEATAGADCPVSGQKFISNIFS